MLIRDSYLEKVELWTAQLIVNGARSVLLGQAKALQTEAQEAQSRLVPSQKSKDEERKNKSESSPGPLFSVSSSNAVRAKYMSHISPVKPGSEVLFPSKTTH